MEHEPTRIDLVAQLREQALMGQMSRRSVFKRAMLLGLSAPVIAGLLAACGGDDDDSGDEPVATAPAAQGDATEAPDDAEPTEAPDDAEPTVAPDDEPTEASDATEAPDEASPTAASGTGSTDTPGKGRGVEDLLRILYWQAPTILNAHFSQGTKDSAASSMVLEPLIDVTADGTLIPVLAAAIPSLEDGSVAEDGMSVTYTLKEGVMWSDGEPFTAEDVKFTWEYTSDEAATTTSISTYEPIESIDVVDDLTVTINFKEPTPGWYAVFATGFGGQIVPKHILGDFMGAKARDAEFNLNPIGTGPYVVAEFRPGDTVIYEMNENYREADKPYFKEVEFKGGGDATSAARAALQTGETDWGWNLQVEKAVLVPMAEGGVGSLVITPGSSVEQILCNFADPNTEVDGARSEPTTQHPYLQFLEVRQAFAMAADRDTVAEELYGPAGEATSNVLVAPENFASPNTTYTFDIEAAAAMLEEAGWTGTPRAKDGVELKGIYQTTINPLRQKTQEIVKAGWEEMGALIELKSIDAGVYFSSDAGNPDTAAHFYSDFEMFTTGPSSPYPIAFMPLWKSNDPAVDIAQKSNEWAGGNYSRFVSEEFNDLYDAALTELDPDAQQELFVAMNDIVVNEYVHIPLVHRADVVGAANKLKGYVPSPWTPDVRDIANWYFEE